MAIVSLNTIKNWFKTGLKPTQAQFWATWDSFRHKSDKVPFAEIEGLDAVLLAQNNKIDAIALPDSVIETGIVYINGLTADIIPEAFVWRLNQVNYLNALAFNDVMPASTDGYIRTDIFVGTNLGTICRVQGPEAIGVAVKLPAPDGTVELAAVDIEGAVASDPVIANPNGDVLSVNGKKGDVVLNKVDVGLGNVDNTSDINKPISIPQQEALDLKVDKSGAKQLSDENYTTGEKNKLASIDATHYLAPLQSIAQLSALPQASIADKARVYVENTLSDYFYDTTASSGDIAPDDQVGAVGFWRQVAVGGETPVSIKSKYESNADTNAYTDAEQTKVAAIDQSVSTTEKATWNGKQNALGFTPENDSNKSQTIEVDKASTTKYGSIAAWITWLKNSFVSNLPAKSTALVDADLLLIGDIEDTSKTKTRTFAQLKATLKTYFDTLYFIEPSQITITTTVSITTDTLGNLDKTQKGKNVIIDNGVNAINLTVNGGTDFLASYLKNGTGAITFIQGVGRTLTLVDATAVFNGAVGSTATISSVGTKDYLRISNAT